MREFIVGDRVLIDTWMRKDVPAIVLSFNSEIATEFSYRVALEEDGTNYQRQAEQLRLNSYYDFIDDLVNL